MWSLAGIPDQHCYKREHVGQEWDWGKTLGERDCEAPRPAWLLCLEQRQQTPESPERKRAEHGASADSKDACSNLKPAGAPSVFRPWASVFQGRSSGAQRASHTPAPTWPTCKLSPGMVSRRLVVVS